MKDATGQEWLLVDEAARAVRVRPGTIRVWATRETVRSQRIGSHRYVHLDDVRRAERLWRQRIRARTTEL